MRLVRFKLFIAGLLLLSLATWSPSTSAEMVDLGAQMVGRINVEQSQGRDPVPTLVLTNKGSVDLDVAAQTHYSTVFLSGEIDGLRVPQDAQRAVPECYREERGSIGSPFDDDPFFNREHHVIHPGESLTIVKERGFCAYDFSHTGHYTGTINFEIEGRVNGVAVIVPKMGGINIPFEFDR